MAQYNHCISMKHPDFINDPFNYPSVNLCRIISKIMEGLKADVMAAHLECNEILAKLNIAFLKICLQIHDCYRHTLNGCRG